jgi:hypothetical protein
LEAKLQFDSGVACAQLTVERLWAPGRWPALLEVNPMKVLEIILLALAVIGLVLSFLVLAAGVAVA